MEMDILLSRVQLFILDPMEDFGIPQVYFPKNF